MCGSPTSLSSGVGAGGGGVQGGLEHGAGGGGGVQGGLGQEGSQVSPSGQG